MSGELVSVVLCTYDQAEYVAGAVQSVLDQSHRPLELIVIDNGSRDGTPGVLSRYAGLPEVRLVRHEVNGAVTTRLNEAIRGSRGAFISLLYGDDLYLPHKLERQLRCFADASPEVGVVYGPGIRLDVRTGQRWVDRSLTASGDVARELVTGFMSAGINPISPLVRRACFERDPFYEDLFIEGEGIFLRFALRTRFQYLAEPLVVMREHPANRGKAYERNTASTVVVLGRIARDPDLPADVAAALPGVHARLERNLGWQLLRVSGDAAAARRYFARAVRRERSRLADPKIVAGWLLSLLPGPLLALANRVGSALSSNRAGLEHREDYT